MDHKQFQDLLLNALNKRKKVVQDEIVSIALDGYMSSKLL